MSARLVPLEAFQEEDELRVERWLLYRDRRGKVARMVPVADFQAVGAAK